MKNIAKPTASVMASIMQPSASEATFVMKNRFMNHPFFCSSPILIHESSWFMYDINASTLI